MSHAQHRNLKAFKWFAGHVVCNVARTHTIKASHAATQFLLLFVVAIVARALSSLFLFFKTLSLFAALFSHVSELQKKSFVSKTISLSPSCVNIAWPVQKRNFELEFFSLARTLRVAS